MLMCHVLYGRTEELQSKMRRPIVRVEIVLAFLLFST
jgi:hypothetical protein